MKWSFEAISFARELALLIHFQNDFSDFFKKDFNFFLGNIRNFDIFEIFNINETIKFGRTILASDILY